MRTIQFTGDMTAHLEIRKQVAFRDAQQICQRCIESIAVVILKYAGQGDEDGGSFIDLPQYFTVFRQDVSQMCQLLPWRLFYPDLLLLHPYKCCDVGDVIRRYPLHRGHVAKFPVMGPHAIGHSQLKGRIGMM